MNKGLTLLRGAAGLALALTIAAGAVAQTAVTSLADTVAAVENRLDAQVGIALINTGAGTAWTHRGDDRFLMTSTVKVPLCGAILARVDAGTLSLDEGLPVRADDILSYAPVTEERVGETMPVADLCRAAIDLSDNTAANLLIDRLGGPQAVTEFFRSIDDATSRLDRREPALNTYAPGDPRDTTTPTAAAATLRTLLLGDALTPASREQLAAWMRTGSVTGALLRAEAPDSWRILDKSGSGRQTRSLVAVITPEGRDPWIAIIYLSGADADFPTRNAAVQEIGRAVIAVIRR